MLVRHRLGRRRISIAVVVFLLDQTLNVLPRALNVLPGLNLISERPHPAIRPRPRRRNRCQRDPASQDPKAHQAIHGDLLDRDDFFEPSSRSTFWWSMTPAFAAAGLFRKP